MCLIIYAESVSYGVCVHWHGRQKICTLHENSYEFPWLAKTSSGKWIWPVYGVIFSAEIYGQLDQFRHVETAATTPPIFSSNVLQLHYSAINSAAEKTYPCISRDTQTICCWINLMRNWKLVASYTIYVTVSPARIQTFKAFHGEEWLILPNSVLYAAWMKFCFKFLCSASSFCLHCMVGQ